MVVAGRRAGAHAPGERMAEPAGAAQPAEAARPAEAANDEPARERLRRWRLVLGGPAEESLGRAEGRDGAMDAALAALYDADGDGTG
jgi:hypothetical protein